jgi:hypothetical protein
MRHPFSASINDLAAALTVVLLATLPIAGQAPQAPPKPKTPPVDKVEKVDRVVKVPRTPDGRPDLQGFWTNATFTPLERPVSLAGKEFFTEAEAAAYEQKRLADEEAQPQDDIHYDNVLWLREKLPKVLSNLRTSLVIDPADGRIPPQTPEARQRAAARAEARKASSPSDVKSRTLTERCIIWAHVGPPMLPAGYNANLQIVQTPGSVMILQEMIHDVRIIPLDGRPRLPQSMRRWMGDSRGHWEGDTLVVDTTNFTNRTNFRGSTETLHVVERFTPVDAATIRYTFTVDDPATWTRPWTGELNIRRFPDRIFEYACAEGNHDLGFLLDLGRKEEQAAEDAAKKKPQ